MYIICSAYSCWSDAFNEFNEFYFILSPSLGNVIEMFGAGTAATVSPVGSILYDGESLSIPLAEGDSGVLAKRVMNTLFDIQYGVVAEHEWAPIIA